MARIVIENCAVATVDADDTEYASGHVVVAGNRIESVGAGPAPAGLADVVRRIDGTGHLVTPGLVNTHHHFYQWITRGLAHRPQPLRLAGRPVPDLVAHRRADGARRRAGLACAMMARGGVTTAMDHHYVFPRGSGDLSGRRSSAPRRETGRPLHPRPRLHGPRREATAGCRRTSPWRRLDGALAATEATVDAAPRRLLRRDDRRSPSRPCSPFSVSTELLRQGAELARRKGVRLHTHGSETVEEEQFCKELFGMGPTDYFESHRLARRGRVDGALRPHERLRHRRLRPHQDGCRALPVLQRPAGRRASPASRTCSRPASRSASAWTAPPPTSPASCTPSCATPC